MFSDAKLLIDEDVSLSAGSPPSRFLAGRTVPRYHYSLFDNNVLPCDHLRVFRTAGLTGVAL
jgi:hypothetical protein